MQPIDRPEEHSLSLMTLYVVANDKPEKSRTARLVESFGEGVIEMVTKLDHRRFNEIQETRNDWYCVFFDNEYLDEKLQASMSTFLNSPFPFEFFTLHKKVNFVKRKEGGGLITEAKFFMGPRIFKKHVKLVEGDALMPVDVNKLAGQVILNGWVLEDDRYENDSM